MTNSNRTFRIFVSSTFTDMKEERNALQKWVFPRLRELCGRYGCRFQPIDLRWGISEEAGFDQRTMKRCMDEIVQCQSVSPQPNFIVLLSHRYGWQPLPPEIPSDEFKLIEQQIKSDSVYEDPDKDDPDLKRLKKWYKEDKNAISWISEQGRNRKVDTVFVLQKRDGANKDSTEWETVEQQLLQTFRDAVGKVNILEHEKIKYEASATHQEILKGALNPRNTQDHAFCFFRKIEGLPGKSNEKNHKILKDYVDLEDPNKHGSKIDNDASDSLEKLKDSLHLKLPNNIFKYNESWTPDGLIAENIGKLPENLDKRESILDENYEPKNLCEAVWQKLGRVIKVECEGFKDLDSLNMEKISHAAFGEERARIFKGRGGILTKIKEYLSDRQSQSLVVHGQSGSGKSAVIARAVKELKDEKIKSIESHDPVIVQRYIGATPDSTNIRYLLIGICKDINNDYGESEFSAPEKFKDLVKAFNERLELATEERPLSIFLDALDQLSKVEEALKLNWFPDKLPEHVKLCVSTLPKPYPCLSILEGKLPKENFLNLKPMLKNKGEAILNQWLNDDNRKLEDCQREEVLNKFARCGMPLYLKLAFEEARKWRSYEGIPKYNGQPGLKDDIPGIIENLFGRLSRSENHGELMVSRTLGYLVTAKSGLTEEEIIDILSMDKQFFDNLRKSSHHILEEERLPVVVWSRFYHDLKPYLTMRTADGTNLLTFYHRQLGEVAAQMYLTCNDKKERHQALANYFKNQPNEYKKEGQKSYNFRKLSELPFQQALGRMDNGLEQTLTDFSFLMSKCAVYNNDDLQEDYQMAFEYMQKPSNNLKIWNEFFLEKSHILRRGNDEWPSNKILLQLAVEHADESPVTRAAEAWLDTGTCDWLWLRNMVRPIDIIVNPCKLILEGHTNNIMKTIELTNHIISWSDDGTCRIWDPITGKNTCTLEKFGSSTAGRFAPFPYAGAVETTDQHTLLWATGSNEVILLDLNTWKKIKTFKHEDCVRGLLLLGKDRFLSWSEDRTARVWCINTGKQLERFKHRGWVAAAKLLSNKSVITWLEGPYTLHIWNPDNGDELAVMTGHKERILGVLELPNKYLLSWAQDDSFRMWTLEGVEVPHSELPDEKTLAFWQTQYRRPDGTYEPHTITQKSSTLLATHFEQGLRLWNKDQPFSFPPIEVKSTLLLSDESVLMWDDEYLYKLSTYKGVIDRFHISSFIKKDWLDSIHGIIELHDQSGFCFWTHDNIWLVDRGDKKIRLQGHTGYIHGVIQMSQCNDGNLLSWSMDSTLRVWNSQTGELLNVLYGHNGKVMGVSELSNGRIMSRSWLWASTKIFGKYLYDDTTIRIWQLPALSSTTMSEQPVARMKSFIPMTEDTIFAYGKNADSDSHDTVWLMDANTGEILQILQKGIGKISMVIPLPDKKIATFSEADETFGIWGVQFIEESNPILTDNKTKSLSKYKLALKQFDLPGELALRPALANARIITCGHDNTLRLWNTEHGEDINLKLDAELKGGMSLDNERMLLWTKDSILLQIWEFKTEQVVVLKGHTKTVSGAKELSNGDIVSWGNDNTLRVWEKNTGKNTKTLNNVKIFYDEFNKNDGSEKVLELSNGHILWVENYKCSVWDHINNNVYRLEKYANAERAIELSNGRIVLIPHYGKILQIAELPDKDPVSLMGHSQTIIGVLELNADYFISWGYDGFVCLWDSRKEELINKVAMGRTPDTQDDFRVKCAFGDRMTVEFNFDKYISFVNFHKGVPLSTVWHSEYEIWQSKPHISGTVVVSGFSGIKFLKLYIGNHQCGFNNLLLRR